jgi:t-SNARE complex subunit (syntaxin)
MNEEIQGTLPDPPQMGEVVEHFNKVQDAISLLGTKVSGIMSQQEEELMSAFQEQCVSIRNEIQNLKLEWDEKEATLKSSDRIKKVETERDWYKKEALRLDSLLKQNQEKLAETRRKLEETKSDYDCLSKKFYEVLNERHTKQLDDNNL